MCRRIVASKIRGIDLIERGERDKETEGERESGGDGGKETKRMRQ